MCFVYVCLRACKCACNIYLSHLYMIELLACVSGFYLLVSIYPLIRFRLFIQLFHFQSVLSHFAHLSYPIFTLLPSLFFFLYKLPLFLKKIFSCTSSRFLFSFHVHPPLIEYLLFASLLTRLRSSEIERIRRG